VTCTKLKHQGIIKSLASRKISSFYGPQLSLLDMCGTFFNYDF